MAEQIRAGTSPGDPNLFTLRGESWLLWLNRQEAGQAFEGLRRILGRHDHADPCDDDACPCFAAGVRSEREANPNWRRP